jgi:hypothetical protein
MVDMDLLIYWKMLRAHVKEVNVESLFLTNVESIFWNLCIVRAYPIRISEFHRLMIRILIFLSLELYDME